MSKVNVYEMRKSIVTFKEGSWKWKDYPLKSICKSDIYGTQKVQVEGRVATVKQAVEHYQKLVDRERWSSAKVLKEAIWKKLDTVSKQRIKEHFDDPEVRIASINNPIVEGDNIVAYYELEDSYYNGENTAPSIMYTEVIPVYYTRNGKPYIHHYNTYTEDHGGIATNSDITFSDFMHTHPGYYWLPQAIAVAKQFGIEPKWRTFIQGNTRGIGLTAHDAKELQQVANWYSGLADADKEDFSDKIWIHHEDGIQSIQISEREYRTNSEKWQDWKETENRDFQCGLHEDDTEDGEQN